MTCWTCEQQLRQSAVHLRRRISKSIYRSLQHARLRLRRRQHRTAYSILFAVLNLKQNLRSTYCSEANDRHKPYHGLFATAERLVLLTVCLRVCKCDRFNPAFGCQNTIKCSWSMLTFSQSKSPIMRIGRLFPHIFWRTLRALANHKH